MVEQVLERESLQAAYDRETEKIVGILKQVEPVKIIRFGSAARGEPRPESDLDLCVLIEWHDDRPAFRIVQSLYRLLSKHKYPYPNVYYIDTRYPEVLRSHERYTAEVAQEAYQLAIGVLNFVRERVEVLLLTESPGEPRNEAAGGTGGV